MTTTPNHLDLYSPRFFDCRLQQRFLHPLDTVEFTPETFGEFLDLVAATNLQKRRAKKRVPFVSLSLNSSSINDACCEAIAQRLPQLNSAGIKEIFITDFSSITDNGVFSLMHADAQCEPPSRIMIKMWPDERTMSARGMYALVNGYDAYLNVMQFKPVIGWFAAKLVCDAVFSHWHVALDGIITFPENYDPDSYDVTMRLDPAECVRWYEAFDQLTDGLHIVPYSHFVYRAFRQLYRGAPPP